MREYEVVWEILNQCPNNQMRDVFIKELFLEDPEQYVKEQFKDKPFSYEKEVLADGTQVFHVDASGLQEKYSFTEL